jgi:O-antigen/teichoic acid export membrane protein
VTSAVADRNDAVLEPAERKAIVLGTIFRVVGTPLVALVGLLNTAVIVRQTGEAVFGLVSLVTTITLLLPFADLGIGAVIISACSQQGRIADDPVAVATVQRGLRRLNLVAAVLIAVSLAIMATDSWGFLLGSTAGPADRTAITIAACLIALGVPAGIGVRILIGINMNQLAVLVSMSNAVFTLLITFGLKAVGVSGIWYAVSGAGGALIGNLIATALALKLSGLGWSAFGRPGAEHAGSKLLQGSLWMFVVSVGLPMGLQSQRLVLSHVSSPGELSRYALIAQIYGVTWMVFSTAGVALWPVFVKRRTDMGTSSRLWLKSVLVFGALSALAGVGLVVLGPWATSVLSGGRLIASRELAIAIALLLFVQCVHLPGGVMLTMPREMRWQSFCLVAMGVLAVVLAVFWGQRWGGAGVVAAAVVATVAAQNVPDFVWIPRLLRRRAQELAPADGLPEAALQTDVADRGSPAPENHYTRTHNDLGPMERQCRENAANGCLAESGRR